MSREKKAQIIDQLEEVFSKSNIGILTDYRGMSTAEMTDLRRRLGESGIHFRVVKNTLARLAAERAGKSDLLGLLQGPVAVASGYSDNVAEPAKIMADYISTSKASLSIKGGFLGDRLLAAEDVTALSRLPSREILLAEVLGGMQAPIQALLNLLNTPVRGFMIALQARIQQLEGE